VERVQTLDSEEASDKEAPVTIETRLVQRPFASALSSFDAGPEFKNITTDNGIRDASVQFFESCHQRRDRAGIERLHPTESVAYVVVQMIAVPDALIHVPEKAAVSFRTTRL
jgi:hypothetical protein